MFVGSLRGLKLTTVVAVSSARLRYRASAL